ncbi:MAG: AP2 domain-containing protein [Sedimentisphaerales bacterium]|jgi:hypothetical protein
MFANYTIKVPVWLDLLFAWPVMLYRQWKYGYDFRRIYLGEGEWTILDQQDYYRLGSFKWHIQGNGRKLYAIRDVKTAPGKTKLLSLHREIMKPPKRFLVDHKNRDSLDNRRENLRLATRAQNSYNRQKKKGKMSSKYIGISFDKRCQRWVVRIEHKGKHHWIGRFKSEEAAAHTYDKAAKKYRGEFACLNFAD